MDTQQAGHNTRMPDRREGDILRTVIAYNHHRVVIRTRFAQLHRARGRFIMIVKLRSSTGKVRLIALLAGPRRDTNQWRGIVTRRDGETPFDCATHRIDYDAGVAAVRIPRSCLNDPRWMQASVAAGYLARNGTFFGDNPKNDGPSAHLPAYSARIRRG
jgi:hypothetical protein